MPQVGETGIVVSGTVVSLRLLGVSPEDILVLHSLFAPAARQWLQSCDKKPEGPGRNRMKV